MNLKQIREGKAEILIPDPSKYEKEGKYDPAWAPVFYNPKMVFNRDISIVAVAVISPKSGIDALSATGVRGIRYYLEANSLEEIILNDKSSIAVELIKKNLALNKISSAIVTNRDANSLLYEIKSDFTDIDPFGSPSPFILSSINSVKNNGYVGYTATDLSPLEGRAIKSCRRKYDVNNAKLSFSKEIGVRVLISKIVREAAILEKAVIPMFTFYHDYYYRLFLKVVKGARKADESLDKLGYAFECDFCGFSSMTKDIVNNCPRCGSKVKLVGKIWLDELNNQEFITMMREKLQKYSYLQTYEEIDKLLNQVARESKFKSHYINLEFLASRYKINVPSKKKVIECLGEATETHFDPKGIKTSKNFDEILECIKSLSGKR